MSIVPCKHSDCERKVLSRGMCSTHYAYWHRANAQYPLICAHCGKGFTYGRKDRATCSSECHRAYTCETPGYKGRSVVLPPTKHTTPKPAAKTPLEIQAIRKSQRSAIRAAYEDQDWLSLLEAIKADSEVTNTGCWEWLRRIKDNYPTVRISGSTHQVHRLALHAKHGKPLGVLHAHHKCANSRCVNPDHLQPVTHRENMAEMLARNSLEARIKELEAALSSISPNHEVLNRISSAA